MFTKPFKIKSNCPLKASDKKLLKELFKNTFPKLTDENLEALLPKKELIAMVKIETSTNAMVYIYTINKHPLAFIYNGILFPTVYFLWEYPDIMLTFTTHPSVLPKLLGGANLMVPGVTSPKLTILSDTPTFEVNAPAYINLTTNIAAVAVGVTAQSSNDMIEAHHKGKCVIVYHVFGDRLCTFDNIKCVPLPELGPLSYIQNRELVTKYESLDSDEKKEQLSELLEELDMNDFDGGAGCSNEPTIAEADEVFFASFLGAIKYSKNITVPVLTSTFYKLHMIPMSPEQALDVKKTSYKKLSVFLNSMCEIGIIKIEEEKKGVDVITEIDYQHPLLVEFYIDPEDRPKPMEKDDDIQPSVIAAHCVTAKVLPIFQEFGFDKGTAITNTSIRKYLTEYVRKYQLQNEEDKSLVKLNGVLQSINPTQVYTTWQALMEKIYNSMTPCYKVTCGGQEVIRKGKLESINITVAKRSGNKKVTLVDNVEVYGIKVHELATACQHGVAASTTINRSQGSNKTDQLQIQGNQVHFIYNILIDKFKVPKKYINGLEFAPKKK